MTARPSFHEERLQPGQYVVVTQDVQERYADLARRILTISAVYDREGEEEGASPYFDETVESYLYEFLEFEDCLYGIELIAVHARLPDRPRLYQLGQSVCLRQGGTPYTITALIEPRLPANNRPTQPGHPVALPWEYVIEGVFSERQQRLYKLSPDAQGKYRLEVSEGLLTAAPLSLFQGQNGQAREL